MKRTSALFEQPLDSQNIQEERVNGATDKVERADAAHGELSECEEEELVTLDVQSAKRVFESQQHDTLLASRD